MNGMNKMKVLNAQQARIIYHYKNIKQIIL